MHKQSSYATYQHGYNGRAIQTNLPGNGLLVGRVGNTELCNNACDVESFLYGIGTSNLVESYSRPVAQLKRLQSLNVIDKTPIIVPEPLVIEPRQRPFPI